MADETYIWVTRWEDFQHYPPDRDRAPAWVKNYTKQLDDDAYLALTAMQRACLHDLRSSFARAHGKLSSDTRRLSHRIGLRVTSETLERLNHAGFIDICSREVLEQRLEKLYSKSRARARPRGRGEELSKDSSKRGASTSITYGARSLPQEDGNTEPAADPEALDKMRAIQAVIGRPVG